MKEYKNLKEKSPFPVYLYEVGGWDDLENISLKTDNFVLLLLADYSVKTIEEISKIAKNLIDKGLKYICSWGPGSGDGDTGFDLGNIQWEEENKKELHVTSTWHDEPLADAVWFCLYSATPDDEYWPSCSTVIVNINGTAPREELDRLLSDIDYLNAEAEAI